MCYNGAGKVAHALKLGTAVRAAARRRLHTAILAAILLLALAGLGSWTYYQSLNSGMRRDDGYYFPMAADEEPVETYLPAADLWDIDEARLAQSLRAWAEHPDEEIIEDRNILNILLCGVDTRTGDARGGRADAVMLVSVNRRKRAVTLTSFLRDSYSYIDLSRDPGNPRAEAGRLADAYALGGPATLAETLSAAYKIPIDDYMCVDFSSFPKLIDALDGVTLDVTQEEADWINRTVSAMKGKFPWGEAVALTGQQALAYSRVSRGPDETRAERQQRLILAILERARQSSPGQILKAVTRVLRYVRTSLTEDEADALVKEAFVQGWLSYSAARLRSPVLPGEEGGTSGLSANLNGRRVWIVDYPREARRLQEAIYGYTNIEGGKGTDYVAGLFK